MIRKDWIGLPLIAAALAVTAPAMAQEVTPVPDRPADPRLVTEVYDDAQVYTINGKVRVQTTIKFAPDEAIQNVAIGDSAAWQVQPNQAQTILFVKPLAASARTNMTVVTSRRTYLFDLIASPRNAPLYVMQFRYPELEAQAREEALAAAAAAEAAAEEQASAPAPADPFSNEDPALLNFAWEGKGESALLPERAYDNGRVMFLTWPEETPIPAILITNENGDEGPVNFTVRGDTVVLDMVPREIILRSGGDRATLTNNGPQNASARSRSARLASDREMM